MKQLIILVMSFFVIQSTGRAMDRLCPAESIEITLCMADADLPYFPFASICQDANAQSTLMLDPGATNSPFIYSVEKSEDAQQIIWSGSDTNSGPLRFIIKKATNTRAVLNIDMGIGAGPEDMTYSCTQ